VNCHDLRLGRVQEPEGLLVHARIHDIFVCSCCSYSTCCCCSFGIICLLENSKTTLVRHLVKVLQIKSFIFNLLSLEFVKELLCGLTTVISEKLNELLLTVVDKFVHLEEHVCFVSKEFSCHILKLVCVENVALSHHCKYTLYQVLKSLIN